MAVVELDTEPSLDFTAFKWSRLFFFSKISHCYAFSLLKKKTNNILCVFREIYIFPDILDCYFVQGWPDTDILTVNKLDKYIC